MSDDLLAKLDELPPASLWSLAPAGLLKQAAGLLAAGDITDLHWTGEGQLEIEFPQRLNTIVHRLRLNGGHIGGKCDLHDNQPCVHHLASLMFACHLLKDFGAFGRFPNRVLAERLKAKLRREDERAVVSSRPAREAQKHVLIRPHGVQLFVFRDSFSDAVQDAFATVPSEVRPFVTYWSGLGSLEDNFWQWFTTPDRRFPVFIEVERKTLAVEYVEGSRWRGQVALTLDSRGLTMRRRLKHDGEPMTHAIVPVGQSLVYLIDTRQLLRLPSSQSWESWHRIITSLQGAGGGLGTRLSVTPNATELEIAPRRWNMAAVPWEPATANFRQSFPTLEWNGEPVTDPPSRMARGRIALKPSADTAILDVEVTLSIDDVDVRMSDEVLHAETEIELHARDGQLLNAKNRRDAVLKTYFTAALEPPGKERRSIIKALEKDECFRNPAQAKRAVRALLDCLSTDGEAPAAPILCASPTHGWLCVQDLQRCSQVTAAIARHILGAALPQHWELDSRKHHDHRGLIIPADTALPRLAALAEACRVHGVDLLYADKPVSIMPLSCRVQASQATNVDFFELKPEVRCGETLIPPRQWEDLAAQGHLIDETGALRVIDLTSIRGLARLRDILQRQQDEEDDERTDKRKRSMDDLVRIPRVRVLDWLLLQKYGIACDLPDSEKAVLESLMSFETLERAPLPAELRATLRDYQHAGFSWMAFLYRHGFGGCLADDMGLGKTLQTITLLAAIKEGIVTSLTTDPADRRPHLLVVPPTLLFNWQHEVKTFYPRLYVHEYTGKGRSLIGIREGIVLTTYDIARRDIESLRERKFDCIIFDEAQSVKNMLGERAKAMRQLEGRCKLVLTGTPLENHAGEYYGIIDLALPGLFGDYREFMNALRQPNGIFNPLDRARPFVLRRTKDKILKELPPKVESDMHLELSESQKQFYTSAVAHVRQEVFAAFADKSAQQAGIVALAALTRLRQICVSPSLIDPAHQEVSPKMQYLVDKLEELAIEGNAALVFSQFTKSLDLLEKHLGERGIARQRLDGSTPQQKRKELVESFQTGKGPGLFLISLKAGGAGLNLTRASYVFHLDPWWNPAAENQASDRAHRMGQKQTVFIQRLLMRHTIEEKIMLMKAQKLELFNRVLAGAEDDGTAGSALITREDFKFLLE